MNASSAPSGDHPELSIVVPAFHEGENLEHLYKEVAEVLGRQGIVWELVIADDGSADQTWATITLLNQRDGRVKGIRLSRNFGHQAALLAGLVHARGRVVASMDADLQHPPAVLVDMLTAWRAGSMIVHTERIDDPETPRLKRWLSRLFYRVYSALTGMDLAAGMADFRLVDRQVLEVLLGFSEERPFFRGLVHWVGYPSTRIAFRAQPRFRGKSKYTFTKMLRLAWSGVSTFTIIPLRLAILLAFLTAIAAISQLGYVITVRVFTDLAIPGWASVMGVMLLLFSALFILIGIIGEYIGRILTEVQHRPRFIVSEQVGLEDGWRLDRRIVSKPDCGASEAC